jgi:hypothetical protein
MTVTDFAWIAVGELLLAATFALGMLVGMSLVTRKDSHNGNGNDGSGGVRGDDA